MPATSANTSPPPAPASVTATAGKLGRAELEREHGLRPGRLPRLPQHFDSPFALDTPISGASPRHGYLVHRRDGGERHDILLRRRRRRHERQRIGPVANRERHTAGAAVGRRHEGELPTCRAPLPAYTADTGLRFDATRGFGWVREDSLGSATHVALDVTKNARDRNLVADQRLDTFIHMQYPQTGRVRAVKTPARTPSPTGRTS